ncbi:MAG: hypothetical protein FJ119_04580 [Deltaproteobacteria bacterium]|nr:hypothetical protein [Deltaproteobacteria bacterium]
MKRAMIALIAVVLFSSAVHAGSCPVKEYTDYLSKIRAQDVNAVVKAANELIKVSLDKNDPCRDQLMHEFRKYYHATMSAYEKKSKVGQWEYPAADSDRLEFEQTIASAGWSLRESEGMYCLGEKAGWFEERFRTILTRPFKKYLRIRADEIQQGFARDAGLLISWDQLGERIAMWEQFLRTYPGFVAKDEIRDRLDVYVRTFVTGMDNSRINNFNSKKLRPDVRAAYEVFIRENRDSAYYTLVRDYYEMLKRKQFNVPDDLKGYFKKAGFAAMLDAQLPAY